MFLALILVRAVNNMSGFVGFVLALELMVALMGLFLAVTPWLMKKQECFTVTIPEFARCDARLRAYQHRYAAFMVGITSCLRSNGRNFSS